jgi:NAD(P)-dependent dehydrogenase (short-subunit alcohol dehydrogenase family)
MPLEGWLNTFHSNLTGAFLMAKHGLPLLANNGHMMFIGAYVDHLRLPKMGAYAAAKAGLEELVTILGKENRRQRFTIVHPGAVNTPFWENVTFKMPADAKPPAQVAQDILQYHQSGKMGILNL